MAKVIGEATLKMGDKSPQSFAMGGVTFRPGVPTTVTDHSVWQRIKGMDIFDCVEREQAKVKVQVDPTKEPVPVEDVAAPDEPDEDEEEPEDEPEAKPTRIKSKGKVKKGRK